MPDFCSTLCFKLRYAVGVVGLVAVFALACSSSSGPAPQETAAAAQAPTPVAPTVDPRDFEVTVEFEMSSAQLTANGVDQLQRFAAKLKPYPERRVHVVGYSEAAGPEEDDRWLSERRAREVAAFLAGHGIAVDHITLEGRGSADPSPVGETATAEVKSTTSGSVSPPDVTSGGGAPAYAAGGASSRSARSVEVSVR